MMKLVQLIMGIVLKSESEEKETIVQRLMELDSEDLNNMAMNSINFIDNNGEVDEESEN